MIRFYCQYSYGGFRTFRINGNSNENLLEQEVTSDNKLDFPALCSRYFNYGGAKLLYRRVGDGEIAIILRSIPGFETDTDGRPISCALQIIGQDEDKELLDNVLLGIINGLKQFETDFAEGFSLRGGLHYDGDFLKGFVDSFRGQTAVGDIAERISKAHGPVYLFVPTSPLFCTDNKLRNKVLLELQLGTTQEELQNTLDNTLSPQNFAALASTIQFVKSDDSSEDEKENVSPKEQDNSEDEDGAEKVEDKILITEKEKQAQNDSGLELKVLDLERTNINLTQENKQISMELSTLKQELAAAISKEQIRKRLLIALEAGCVVLALGWILTAFFK